MKHFLFCVTLVACSAFFGCSNRPSLPAPTGIDALYQAKAVFQQCADGTWNGDPSYFNQIVKQMQNGEKAKAIIVREAFDQLEDLGGRGQCNSPEVQKIGKETLEKL